MRAEVFKDNKLLRCGYTTGTCAAAAAKAAAAMLLGREKIENIAVVTPDGTRLMLDIEDINSDKYGVSCAVRKDSGDDPDVTNGILIYARVCKTASGIEIDGGEGIGRVTREGLNQPVGAAAINSTPRQCIKKGVEEICKSFGYSGGIKVVIYAPDGRETAEKTLNSALGIIGGISILGTSGIVEPMSEDALKSTIELEIKMKSRKNGYIAAVPGHYGEVFAENELGLNGENIVTMSNYIGCTIDYCNEQNVKGLLLVGHIGKLVKLGAGIMDTHSKNGDARAEIMAAACIRAGADIELVKAVLECITTDEAIGIIKKQGLLDEVMTQIINKAERYLKRRAYDMPIGAVIFSDKYGFLGKTENADKLIKLLNEV